MDRANQVLHEIESLARQQFLPIVGPVKGKVLADLVRNKKPRRVLEIGTLVGYSAILMTKNQDKEGRIISLEIDPELAIIAQENIKRAGLEHRIEIVVGDALEVLPKLSGLFSARGGPAFGWDFVFIDAAKEEYLEYLKLIEDKLSPEAVIVADNAKIFADAMADYLSYVRDSGKYKSKFIDCGEDGLEVSILSA